MMYNCVYTKFLFVVAVTTHTLLTPPILYMGHLFKTNSTGRLCNQGGVWPRGNALCQNKSSLSRACIGK